MESTLKNMVLVLLIITAVAALAVGGVYVLTKKPIEQAKINKINTAIAAVMPDFDNVPSQEKIVQEIDGQVVNVYPARVGDSVVGYAIETFSKSGFGGQILLMVGILGGGDITSISVIEHKETPGLGDKIEAGKSDFGVQFRGKNPATFNFKVTKDGGDVDAITASTITSRAYTDAVERAYRILELVR